MFKQKVTFSVPRSSAVFWDRNKKVNFPLYLNNNSKQIAFRMSTCGKENVTSLLHLPLVATFCEYFAKPRRIQNLHSFQRSS